jgi:hypothetical protein
MGIWTSLLGALSTFSAGRRVFSGVSLLLALSETFDKSPWSPGFDLEPRELVKASRKVVKASRKHSFNVKVC